MTLIGKYFYVLTLALLLVGSSASAESIAGKVVKVADGDVIAILVEREQVRFGWRTSTHLSAGSQGRCQTAGA